MTVDELRLIARVLAWVEGEGREEINHAPQSIHWMDAAQQCAEELEHELTWGLVQ